MNAKRAFVVAQKAHYPITQLCRILGIARSWFYGFERSQPARGQREKLRTDRDAELLPKIKEAFSQSKKRYGSKRVHQDLKTPCNAAILTPRLRRLSASAIAAGAKGGEVRDV